MRLPKILVLIQVHRLFAPQCVLLGTRNVWMNISQDGKDDLNQLRERNTLTALKRVSENFQSITAFQVSAYGPSRAKSASRSLRRALLTPQVNAGSLYRCGKRT